MVGPVANPPSLDPKTVAIQGLFLIVPLHGRSDSRCGDAGAGGELNLLRIPAPANSGELGEQRARFINRPHRQGPQKRHLHARQVNGVAPARE